MRALATLGILFLMLFWAIVPSIAQGEKWIKKGDDFFNKQDYTTALDLYRQAREANPKNAYANLRLAQCYLLSSSKHAALQFASDAVKYSPKPHSELYFTLDRKSVV